jgi:glycosyltransferase involved in cell wall biosynthesis
MRGLFVAPYLPTPGSGGRTRLINLMARLAAAHDLALVAFAARDQDGMAAPYPGVVLPPPALHPRPAGAAGAARFYSERLLDPLPSFVQWMFRPEMVAALRTTIERFRPHVVQVETTEMAQYLRAIPLGPVRVLDLQDVASGWFERAAPTGETRKQRALLRLELRKTRRYDRRHARMAEVVFVSSEPERELLLERAGVDAIEIPNGVDTLAFVPTPDLAERPARILFVGPLSYDANLDGLRWFCREVLPGVRAQVPDVGVDVVGEPVDEPFPPGVTLHGRVPDVRPWLAGAPVSIVPVRVGSGTRYKILEALSMARAVVATTVGAEGLGVRDREHLLVTDDPEGFATAVVELLRAPGLRARLGAEGRVHVAARYDWGPVVARVSESWEGAVASTR